MPRYPSGRHRRPRMRCHCDDDRGLLGRLVPRLVAAWLVDVVKDLIGEYFNPFDLFS